MVLVSAIGTVAKTFGRIVLKLVGGILIVWLAGQAGMWSFLYL
jgi:hypothetical protein